MIRPKSWTGFFTSRLLFWMDVGVSNQLDIEVQLSEIHYLHHSFHNKTEIYFLKKAKYFIRWLLVNKTSDYSFSWKWNRYYVTKFCIEKEDYICINLEHALKHEFKWFSRLFWIFQDFWLISCLALSTNQKPQTI